MRIDSLKGKPFTVPPGELHSWGYQNEHRGLLVYAIRDDFVQVLADSVPGGVWIAKKDLAPHFWVQQFIDEYANATTWQFHGYDQFAVRAEPADDSKVLLVLDENKHVIRTFTGKRVGPWAEAEVYQTQGGHVDGCEDAPAAPGKEWRGWIKLFNDLGIADTIGIYQSC